MTSSPSPRAGRISSGRADEVVDDPHSSPKAATFSRAAEDDPRETGAGIVVVGSLNADLMIYCDRLPAPGETVQGSGFVISPGGKSANQAVAAGRLGGSVRLLGTVGNDANGTMLLESVAAAGVDVAGVRRHATEPTGVALISVDSAGENTIVIAPGANGTLTPADLDPAAFAGAAVVCLCLEVPVPTVIAAARIGRAAGATVVLNPSPYALMPAQLTELVDVLVLNAHEAALFLDGAGLTDPAGPEDAAGWARVRAAFEARGLLRVVVTLGAHGSMVLDSSNNPGESFVSPTRVEAVDTTGAGDAFTGALATRLAAGDDMTAAATFASVAGALATMCKGTQAAYPTEVAVRQRLTAAPPT